MRDFIGCVVCHSYIFKFSFCSNSEHNLYSPKLRQEDENGSPGSTTNASTSSSKSFPCDFVPSHSTTDATPHSAGSHSRSRRPLTRVPSSNARPRRPRQQSTWLKETAQLDPAWKKRVQHSYKLLVDTISAYPERLKVSHGPATVAPIDLVMMVLLVLNFTKSFQRRG